MKKLLILTILLAGCTKPAQTPPNYYLGKTNTPQIYRFKNDTPDYKIKENDAGCQIVVTLDTDIPNLLPETTTIHLRLIEPHDLYWQIVTIQPITPTENTPGILPLGSTSRRIVIWDDLQRNNIYQFNVLLHKLNQPDNSKFPEIEVKFFP